jgi:hypothetical protein
MGTRRIVSKAPHVTTGMYVVQRSGHCSSGVERGFDMIGCRVGGQGGLARTAFHRADVNAR